MSWLQCASGHELDEDAIVVIAWDGTEPSLDDAFHFKVITVAFSERG